MKNKIKTILCLLLFTAGLLSAEDIMTATAYFNQISENYGVVEDYQADIEITKAGTTMKGILFYKSPDKIRINFSEPEDQVLSLDGEMLSVYIPQYRVIMEQKLEKTSGISGVSSITTQKGLKLLKKNYSIAYLKTPDQVRLNEEESDSEMVVKLKLIWKSTDESFRKIELSIGESKLIRRMTGYTDDYDEIIFDFSNIIINQNIPDARFKFDGPANANIYKNFLFEPEN